MASPASTATSQGPVAHRPHPTDPPRAAAKWLGFQSAHAHYLLPLAHAGEVLQAADVTPVPFTQPWFRGVVSVRGGLLGVVDLDGFLAVYETVSADPGLTPDGSLPKTPPQGPLVTLSAALQPPCALAMGTLLGLRGADDFDPPAQNQVMTNPLVFCTYEDRSHTRWIEIHLPALIASARMRPVALPPGAA